MIDSGNTRANLTCSSGCPASLCPSLFAMAGFFPTAGSAAAGGSGGRDAPGRDAPGAALAASSAGCEGAAVAGAGAAPSSVPAPRPLRPLRREVDAPGCPDACAPLAARLRVPPGALGEVVLGGAAAAAGTAGASPAAASLRSARELRLLTRGGAASPPAVLAERLLPRVSGMGAQDHLSRPCARAELETRTRREARGA